MLLERALKEQACCGSHFTGANSITAACGGGLVCTGCITLSSISKSNPIMRISSFHPSEFQETWKLTEKIVI